MTAVAGSPATALLADLGARAGERALVAMLSGLEHLLRQQSWARKRLRAHAGLTIRIAIDTAALPAIPVLPRGGLLVTIDSEGLLRQATPDADPAVTLHLKPSVDAAFELLLEGPPAATRHLRVEGDPALATTIGDLARQLRWDAEEDLSRVTGDVAARRIGRLVEAGLAGIRDAGGRIRVAAVRYVADDQRVLATRPMLGQLGDAIRGLDERVAALERRAGKPQAG